MVYTMPLLGHADLVSAVFLLFIFIYVPLSTWILTRERALDLCDLIETFIMGRPYLVRNPTLHTDIIFAFVHALTNSRLSLVTRVS